MPPEETADEGDLEVDLGEDMVLEVAENKTREARMSTSTTESASGGRDGRAVKGVKGSRGRWWWCEGKRGWGVRGWTRPTFNGELRIL